MSLLRGKPGNRQLKEEVVEQIRRYMHQPIMDGFKPTLMREKLEEVTGIRVMISASNGQQEHDEAPDIFERVGKIVPIGQVVWIIKTERLRPLRFLW